MTIKELKEAIRDLDDNMRVGGAGHFGEFLDCYFAEVRTVTKARFDDTEETIFCITLEPAGEEPD